MYMLEDRIRRYPNLHEDTLNLTKRPVCEIRQ